MIDLENLFDKIQQRFNAQMAANTVAVFQFDLSTGQAFSFEVNKGQCVLLQGTNESANITLSLEGTLLVDIVSGDADPLQAFMEGKIQAQGDLSLAPLLAMVFAPKV